MFPEFWPLFAQTTPVEAPVSVGLLPDTFWPAFLATIIFGITGIVLAAFGFKLFDWISPGLKIDQELSEKQNIAVAIVCAAVILGTFHLVAVVCQ